MEPEYCICIVSDHKTKENCVFEGMDLATPCDARRLASQCIPIIASDRWLSFEKILDNLRLWSRFTYFAPHVAIATLPACITDRISKVKGHCRRQKHNVRLIVLEHEFEQREAPPFIKAWGI
jgi:hypothetical protein